MRKLRKRDLRITINDDRVREEFLNKLLGELKIDNVKVEAKGKTITITLYGTKDVIEYNWNIIKNLKKEIFYLHSLKTSNIKCYPHSFLQKYFKITFPLKVLEFLLKNKGFYAKKLQENVLETDASLEEISELVKRINEVSKELRVITKSLSTKKFLSVLSASLEISVEKVKKIAMELGLLIEDERGYAKVTKEWEVAVSEFLRRIKERKDIEK